MVLRNLVDSDRPFQVNTAMTKARAPHLLVPHDAMAITSFADIAARTHCDGGLSVAEAAAFAGLVTRGESVFAAAYDADGRYLWVSPSLAASMKIAAAELVGTRLHERFPLPWCDERLKLIQRVLHVSHYAHVIEIFRGRRVESTVHAVTQGTSSPFALLVARFGRPCPPSSASTLEHLIEADWGLLSSLTRRELEVLRLIARGLDNLQIAAAIHRTKRAVEWHITNLFQLLKCERRTELFQHGLLAGLNDIDDAAWSTIVSRIPASHD